MSKYLLTPSLLNNFSYYIQDEWKSPTDSRADFLKTLSRERFEPNEAQQRGIDFEDDIEDYCNGKFQPTFKGQAMGEIISLDEICPSYEEERDPNGNTRISVPWERISYLERIEQNGGAVLYQDFSNGEERICVIRAIQFEQAAPPTFASGFGGIVTIQLQTIDTEQIIS